MKTATIQRKPSTEEGTFGDYTSYTGFKCVTLERPSDGDHPCIPAGQYICDIHKSSQNYNMVNGAKDYRLYELLDVPDRTEIFIHSGNWFFQILGCILMGREIAQIETPYKVMMTGVTASRDTLSRMMADMGWEPFVLTILDPK
jgi:hypothetical protein